MIFSFLLIALLLTALLLSLLFVIAKLFLSAPDLSQFDDPSIAQRFADHPDDAAANQQLTHLLRSFRQDLRRSMSLRKGLARARQFADQLSDDLQTDSRFIPVQANGMSCEWTVAPDVDQSRRILFMHGGAFFLGSPRGHRRMTDQLSKRANAAVLSVDYAMLPESSRTKGIKDCQAAYHWILENGPEGPSRIAWLMISGDSAGGNLALMLSSWSRMAEIRRPDGVVCFSPSCDVTMASPSLLTNRASDPVLREGVGSLLRLPITARAWLGLLLSRANPASPDLSPVFNDLAELPPTLIQASSSEMLVGEAIRYANKAQAAGSEVRLQLWDKQVHDWQLFNLGIGSANSAWREVEKFVKSIDS